MAAQLVQSQQAHIWQQILLLLLLLSCASHS
jgi:hypothetical protein